MKPETKRRTLMRCESPQGKMEASLDPTLARLALTNQRPVFRSRDLSQPMVGEYHLIEPDWTGAKTPAPAVDLQTAVHCGEWSEVLSWCRGSEWGHYEPHSEGTEYIILILLVGKHFKCWNYAQEFSCFVFSQFCVMFQQVSQQTNTLIKPQSSEELSSLRDQG